MSKTKLNKKRKTANFSWAKLVSSGLFGISFISIYFVAINFICPVIEMDSSLLIYCAIAVFIVMTLLETYLYERHEEKIKHAVYLSLVLNVLILLILLVFIKICASFGDWSGLVGYIYGIYYLIFGVPSLIASIINIFFFRSTKKQPCKQGSNKEIEKAYKVARYLVTFLFLLTLIFLYVTFK